MARKNRKRLGHVTEKENAMVVEAIGRSTVRCLSNYHTARNGRKEFNACIHGVKIFRDALLDLGFMQ